VTRRWVLHGLPCRSLAALCLVMWAGSTAAQANWRELAVPYFSLDAFAAGAATATAGRAGQLAVASQHLHSALATGCSTTPPALQAADARAAWRAAVTAWDALASLSTGPLIERRSARSIDFMPARPELLARAIAAEPRTAEDMERIGAPARGFPALELLLWPTLPTVATPPCAYAVMLAADIEREALALQRAAAMRARNPAEGEAALVELVETVNQWLGGVEQLRWAFMRKPLEMAATRGLGSSPAAPVDFPRRVSGQTAATWAARWATLRDTAVLGTRALPVAGAPLPFETLLRGRGLNPLADRLVAATARADRALLGLGSEAAAPVLAAAMVLGELTRLAQDELAPAIGVRLGFSDADGD
jgi:uncharacterized protein